MYGLVCEGNPSFESRVEGKSKGKICVHWDLPLEDHSTKPVMISCAFMSVYSHGGFERSYGCTLQFPYTELFPLHNFQKWDCHFR